MNNFTFKSGNLIQTVDNIYWIVIQTNTDKFRAISLDGLKNVWEINQKFMTIGYEKIIYKVFESPYHFDSRNCGEEKFEDKLIVLWDRRVDFTKCVTLEELGKQKGVTILIRNNELYKNYFKDGNVLVTNISRYVVIGDVGVSDSGFQTFRDDLTAGSNYPDFYVTSIYVGVPFGYGFEEARKGFGAKETVLIYESIKDVEKEFNVNIWE